MCSLTINDINACNVEWNAIKPRVISYSELYCEDLLSGH